MERRRLIEEPAQLALELPAGRRRVELDEEPHVDRPLTEWEGNIAPPCSGYWDVKAKSLADTEARVFYYGPLEGKWVWWDPSPHRTSEEGRQLRIAHDVLCKTHAWRGLKAPAASYDYLIKYPEVALVQYSSTKSVTFAPSTRRRIID